MKIVTVVGARPQFIKAAAVSRILRENSHEVLVHTGQHYDRNMSEVFFKELKIPEPDYNLEVGSASHARQTAGMMIGIEEILQKEKPDALLVYGDTNSTLAGSLAAVKLNVPVVHVEAGLRCFDMSVPEEQNRILTDRISRVLFCPTDAAVKNLSHEGITENVYLVGDVMCDAVLYYSKPLADGENMREKFFARLKRIAGAAELCDKWYLATIHRAGNTRDIRELKEIFEAFEQLDWPVLFPVHPRTRGMALKLMEEGRYGNILCTEPLSYLEMLFFNRNAVKVITDSGGLQKEAYLLGTPCITVRDRTEWVETLAGNHNILARPERGDILKKVYETKIDEQNHPNYYGDGNAAKRLTGILEAGGL